MNANLQRQHFFDTIVHLKPWKDSMSGRNEDRAIEILASLGYFLDRDYIRQHPIGERFVIDFAFQDERIALEIDGKGHDTMKQRKKDRKRDSFLARNGWVPLRIKDQELFGYKGSFWKNVIKLVVQERREQRQNGDLYPIDIDRFHDADYE